MSIDDIAAAILWFSLGASVVNLLNRRWLLSERAINRKLHNLQAAEIQRQRTVIDVEIADMRRSLGLRGDREALLKRASGETN